MPKHYEFVLAAYLIWVGVFALYFFTLHRKSRNTRKALDRLSGTGGVDGNRS